MLGKCPNCDRFIGYTQIVDMPLKNSQREFKGYALLCPLCHTILATCMDELALQKDTVDKIVKMLRGK